MRNTNVNNVWGRRPHTFLFRFYCAITAPRIPPDTICCGSFVFVLIRSVPGDGPLQPDGLWPMTNRICVVIWIEHGDPWRNSYFRLCNSASGPEIGLAGRISAGFESGEPQNRPSGWPRPAGELILSLEFGRKPARKPDFRPRSTIA